MIYWHHGFPTAVVENWGKLACLLAYPLTPTIVQGRVPPPPKTLPPWQPSRPLQVVEQNGLAKCIVVIRSWECQHSRHQTGPHNGSYHQSVHIQHHHHPHDTAKISSSTKYWLRTYKKKEKKTFLRIRSNSSSACSDLQMGLAKLASWRLRPIYCIAKVGSEQTDYEFGDDSWLRLVGKLPGYERFGVWQTVVDDVSRSWHWFINLRGWMPPRYH